MVKVKICGLTNLRDAEAALEMGADALGFVFAASPRQITPDKARDIIEKLPPFITKVGVFSGTTNVGDKLRAGPGRPETASPTAQMFKDVLEYCGLHLAQLHGDISPALCQSLFPRSIRAIQVTDASSIEKLPDYRAAAYLLDGSSGGKGMTFNWNLAKEGKKYGLIILAGGLTPENVGEAVNIVEPYAVDVSSGVESYPGKKDHKKMKLFIENAKVEKGSHPAREKT